VHTSRWPAASSDADFSPYLAGRPEASAEMFWRFAELARLPGPATFELQDKVVVLSGTQRIYGSVRILSTGLGEHLNLGRRVADQRIVKVENLTRNVIFHRCRVSSMSDLDDEFGRWLAEAHAIGDGDHSSRTAVAAALQEPRPDAAPCPP
jgi:hypothetical protein